MNYLRMLFFYNLTQALTKFSANSFVLRDRCVKGGFSFCPVVLFFPCRLQGTDSLLPITIPMGNLSGQPQPGKMSESNR
jgi:hypothetical protein